LAAALAAALLATSPADAADRIPADAGLAPGNSAKLGPDGPGETVLGSPAGVPFQGFLTDGSGDPLGVPSPVDVTVDFRFYDAAAAGTLLHSEAHVVTVTEGVFQAALSPPASLFHSLPRYLGLAVDGGSELTPRTEVLSTPFSLVSRTLSGFGAVDAQLLEGGGVTEIVAGTTDQLMRSFFLDSAASSWTGKDGHVIVVANGQGVGGGGVVTVSRGGFVVAALAVPAAGGRSWTFVVDVPGLSASEIIDVSARADAAGAPLLVRRIALETGGAGGAADGDWTIVGSDMNSAVAGNVGIGVAAASTNAKLDVAAGGASLAAEFQGDVQMSDDLAVGRVVRADSLDAPSGSLAMDGNITSVNGDFYAAALNGVINCGGGLMRDYTNILADTLPTISFAVGDEDLVIQDDLEVLGDAYKPGGGSWSAVSDVRLKKDVRDFEDGLDAVLRMNPVWYRYNEKSGFADGREHVGVVAQDMLEIAPYMVEEKPAGQVIREDERGNEVILEAGENVFTYDPSALVYLLVNAVQEQQKMIEQQHGRIEELERRIDGR
jgi:hypothetical protein